MAGVEGGRGWSYRWILPLTLLLTALVYARVAWHDFINFDDDVFVYENPVVSRGLTLDGVLWGVTTPYEANWIPLTWVSHMLDVSLFGLNPGGHHLVNLLFHLGSTALLYLLLLRMTDRPPESGMVALLFALHPMRVESVAWIAERKDVLSTFLALLTLLLYARHAERPSPRGYLCTLGAFAAALLAKSMVVTIPLVMFLLDVWPLGRFSWGTGVKGVPRQSAGRLLVEKIPFLTLSAIVGVITYRAQTSPGDQGYTLIARTGRALVGVFVYLRKTLLPTDLAVIYPFEKYGPPPTTVLLALTGVTLITVGAFLAARRAPWCVTGWLWFLVTLAPVSGIIQIGQHSVADRYTYLPHIGLFIGIVWSASHLLRHLPRGETVALVTSLLVASLCAIGTSLQLRHWKDGFAAMSRAVQVSPGNWVALNNLGLLHLKQGNSDEAIRLFTESIRAKPSYSLAHLNLGVAYMMRGEFGKARDAYLLGARFDPYSPKIHLGLGTVYLALGEREKALEEYRILREMGAPEGERLYELLREQNTLPPSTPQR